MSNTVPCARCEHHARYIHPIHKDFPLLCTTCKKQVWRTTIVVLSICVGLGIGVVLVGILGLVGTNHLWESIIYLIIGSMYAITFIILLRLNWEKRPV